ncbi:Tripartite tricarboxylate transporter family receptor [Pigmentiphaga humi]|uniref:Tripartite tricarboxylate transporter family receptor n=1 Tax=Pigmentiphaga humi TaxID=2478468 RepID=A0A3P4AZD5_9BURK|nr:tripartite tricarboxylate transporter substrate binding protein [Pigmentiphaga humi]VCU68185.1 Tripartite tricarboxylate transporter family receptor [Pigmentiphaga humi]
MQWQKRNRSWIWSALALFAATAASASAQEREHASFPSRALTLVVPLAPGGVADITARMVAQKVSESVGQSVVVENRPGAASAVASVAVKNAKPDGYTLLLNGNGSAISASLFKSLPYDVQKDFVCVSTMGRFDLVVLVDAQSRFKSIADIIAYAKANPGKLNIGTVTAGSTQFLSAVLFTSMAGIQAPVVPFKSTAEVVNAVRGSQVDLAFEIVPPVLSQLRAHTMRALAITSPERFAGLPEVPTLSESGVQGYEASSWNGISVPAQTPRPIVDRLSKEINLALADPAVAEKLKELGITPLGSTSDEMCEHMKAEIGKWRTVIMEAGIPQQ